MHCKFCNKECKNPNSLRNHERLCKLNPERQTTPFQDPEKYAEIVKNRGNKNQWSNPDYVLSDETRRKLSATTKLRNKLESEATKQKRRDSINNRVANGTWHTSLAKNHHYFYKGVNLHGNWELQYAIWLDKNNIKWSRCTESFEYYFEGKQRKYTPDFYLQDTGEYIEIKGYKTSKDDAKWSQFPKDKTLIVLMKHDLEKLQVIGV